MDLLLVEQGGIDLPDETGLEDFFRQIALGGRFIEPVLVRRWTGSNHKVHFMVAQFFHRLGLGGKLFSC